MLATVVMVIRAFTKRVGRKSGVDIGVNRVGLTRNIQSQRKIGSVDNKFSDLSQLIDYPYRLSTPELL